MFSRVWVQACELSEPIADVICAAEYRSARLLLLWQHMPFGYLDLPVRNGQIAAATIRQMTLAEHGQRLSARQDRQAVEASLRLAAPAHPSHSGQEALTIAICTRDRTDDLRTCLTALAEADISGCQVLVVDNAPATTATRDLMQKEFPYFAYHCESNPGLDHARNHAIAQCGTPILAFIDDDVIVDGQWAQRLRTTFADFPDAAAVTGLVAPLELETPAQARFEAFNGFGKGFQTRVFSQNKINQFTCKNHHLMAGRFGTGANMAFRTRLFEEIGGFLPYLDVGTPTQGGGDLEMFFRIIQHGRKLVYQPSAFVWHKHRQSNAGLDNQIYSWGISFSGFLWHCFKNYRRLRMPVIGAAWKWCWRWNVRRALKMLLAGKRDLAKLAAIQLAGACIGIYRYEKARRIATGKVLEFRDNSSNGKARMPQGAPTAESKEAASEHGDMMYAGA